jgi:hypothetical protein
VDLSYFLSAGSMDLSPSLQVGEIARAVAEWSRVRGREVAAGWRGRRGAVADDVLGPSGSRGRVSVHPRRARPRVLPGAPSPEPIGGDIHFNDSFDWGAGDPTRYDVFSVALHESGHSLGLAHSSNPAAVMYPMYRGIVSSLGEEDIAAIQSLYASAPALPEGWHEAAIGGATAGGAMEHDGAITVSASGRDVWGAADDFRFVSRTLRGDGDVIARVDSLDAVHRWRKPGS